MAEREGAEIKYGQEALDDAIKLLEDQNLPGGLLPLVDVIESGHVKESGYVWIKQKQEIRHLFKIAGREVSYGAEIKGYLQKNRLRYLQGVFAKELLIWAPIGEISVDPAVPGKISFKSIGGIRKAFPVEAFIKGE